MKLTYAPSDMGKLKQRRPLISGLGEGCFLKKTQPELLRFSTLCKARWQSHPMYRMKNSSYNTSLKPREEKFYASSKILNDFYIKVKMVVLIHADQSYRPTGQILESHREDITERLSRSDQFVVMPSRDCPDYINDMGRFNPLQVEHFLDLGPKQFLGRSSELSSQYACINILLTGCH